jgi:hypothetical protein
MDIVDQIFALVSKMVNLLVIPGFFYIKLETGAAKTNRVILLQLKVQCYLQEEEGLIFDPLTELVGTRKLDSLTESVGNLTH